MAITGKVRKMRAKVLDNASVNYELPLSDNTISMNELIGNHIEVQWTKKINCIHCDRPTKKSFNQGYCFPCVQRLAQCDTCIIKPELCHYDQGTCREPQWGETNCLKDHFVYLSNTGNIKVGITRFADQLVSSRWLDQGATQALAILRVQNRLVSGLVEKAIGKHIGDKTNWRTMLKGNYATHDLEEKRDELLALAREDLDEISDEYGLSAIQYISGNSVEITYPVIQHPEKIKSINLDKEFGFSGVLLGIKGQYLLLDQDRVINVRKYAGYELTFNH